jgi:hypothetical protein
VEWVERENGGMVLVKHQTDDGAKRNQRTHRERELETWGFWRGIEVTPSLHVRTLVRLDVGEWK